MGCTLIPLLLCAAMSDPQSAQVVERYPSAFEAILRAADAALEQRPLSVMDKRGTAPSGDKHDFYTLSPYHWPNPDSSDGLPYVFRDGELNPDAGGPEYDRAAFFKTCDAVEALALAYRYTRKPAYGARAALMLRTWFLDPETRMNPHLAYAQHVPGETVNRGWGIIRGIQILRLAEASDWLEDAPEWTEADRSAWRAWQGEFARWLRTSDPGIRESRALNNHGTWYDVQVASFALRSGDTETARAVLEAVPAKRIERQMLGDGAQVLELVRTRSWHYSVMNLDGLFRLATLGEQVGLDLWRYSGTDGRSLRAALDFLMPSLAGERPWAFPDNRGWQPALAYPLLRRAAIKYAEPRYREVADAIPDVETEAARDHLWYPIVE